MKKTIVLTLLLVFVLGLAACDTQPAEPAEEVPAEIPAEEASAEEPPIELESGLAIVDSVAISQQGDQYLATVNGSLPDGCTQISGTSQSVQGNTINITVETQRPADMMCTQAITPYSEEVVIDTLGLADGTYTVVANGVTADQPVIVGDASADPVTEEPPNEMESGLAIVDGVAISQQGDKYLATVNGSLPDGCTQIAGTSQSVEGNTINITVETQRPADMMCTQAITPYSEEVVIDTLGLADGTYTVVANGVTADQPVIVGDSSAAPVTEEPGDGSEILNVVWQWNSVLETDPAAQAVVPDPENYTVTLHADGSAAIKADCNQVQVTYTLEGSSLVFNMLGPSTLAFCGEESLDTQFLGLLGSVNSWVLEEEQLKMSTTGGATVIFDNGGAAPGSVGIDPSQISLDTQGLPYSWQAVVVPLQPYDASQPPGPQGLPEHIQILFGVSDPADRQHSDPIMYIIPVESYEAMYEANENSSVTSSMNSIAGLTYELPEPAPTSGYPVLPHAPYSPALGYNDLAVQLGRAAADDLSASKNGFRYVARSAQDANPVTNQNLFYIYQGFTNDGQYLVSFFYPVRTEQLADDPSGVAQEDMDAFNADSSAHMADMAARLNQLSTSDWQPDLATLDALVGSLQIEGMVASGIQQKAWDWTSATVDGGEEAAVENPTAYTVFYNEDGTFQFRADCNSGSGGYEAAGGFSGTLAMQPGPITLAACPPESRSDEYLGYLLAADEFQLQPGGRVMDLLLPGGAGTVSFSEAGTADVDLPEPEAGETTGIIIAEAGANVRLGPGTSFPSIGVAAYGTTGTIIGVSQDRQWWAADVPDSPSRMGWVLASLVEVQNGDVVPVIPAPVAPVPTPAPTPNPPPSATISFWADPSVINEGDCSALTWNVENIQAVWVYPQGQNYQDYGVPGNGSMSVCPTQTTTYEMRVQHIDGSIEFRAVTVTVNPSNSLGNTSWFVSSLYVNQVPLPGSSMNIWFGGGGNVSVNGGCNTFNGTYTVSGSNLSFGPLAGTRISCGEALDTQEQAYLSALGATTSYAISGSQLILYDGSGQEVARFNFGG